MLSFFVVSPKGKVRRVQNLGWLLRNNKKISCFEISSSEGDLFARGCEAVMRAVSVDGSVFYSSWPTRRSLAAWLDRPMFRGRTVFWFGQAKKAGFVLAFAEGA